MPLLNVGDTGAGGVLEAKDGECDGACMACRACVPFKLEAPDATAVTEGAAMAVEMEAEAEEETEVAPRRAVAPTELMLSITPPSEKMSSIVMPSGYMMCFLSFFTALSICDLGNRAR